MANGSVTASGLDQLIKKVDRFPETLVRDLSTVAGRTAHRIESEAKRRLLAQSKAVKTAASIHVIDESKTKKQFVIDVPGHPDDPANVPLWLERGTIHQSARPYLRPAADGERDRYVAQMTSAYNQITQRELGD